MNFILNFRVKLFSLLKLTVEIVGQLFRLP